MKLTYTTKIQAPVSKVWDTMMKLDTYKQWVRAFSEDCTYVGEWVQGTEIKFIDTNKGGTKAVLDVVEPERRVLARHIAMIAADGTEITTGKDAEAWIGTTEEYFLEEQADCVVVTVYMDCPDNFREMFDTCWPKALEALKQLCEA